MNEYAITTSGIAIVAASGIYYNIAPDSNVTFRGASVLQGDVTVVGSVVRGLGYREVFDFSETDHFGQRVLVYGSTANENLIDGADSGVGGGLFDKFIAREGAGNDLTYYGNDGNDAFIGTLGGVYSIGPATHLPPPPAFHQYFDGGAGGADRAELPTYLFSDVSGKATFEYWEESDTIVVTAPGYSVSVLGNGNTAVQTGGIFHLDNTESIHFEDGRIFKNFDLNSNEGKAMATELVLLGHWGTTAADEYLTDALDDAALKGYQAPDMMKEVAKAVLNDSPEVLALSSYEYVKWVFANTGQDADKGEVTNAQIMEWVGHLEGPNADMDRADVAVSFALSVTEHPAYQEQYKGIVGMNDVGVIINLVGIDGIHFYGDVA